MYTVCEHVGLGDHDSGHQDWQQASLLSTELFYRESILSGPVWEDARRL